VLDAHLCQLYDCLHSRRRQRRVNDDWNRRELPPQLLQLGDLDVAVGRRVRDKKIYRLFAQNCRELSPPFSRMEPVPATQNDSQVREELRGEERSDVHDLPGPMS
jgi:hypothetical protein